MVAIVAGNGIGIERSSASVLGQRGKVGSSALGRAAENVYVNAATGNLVITRQDEFLVGMGPDVAIARTYNSQRSGDSDNGDGWRASFNRKVGFIAGSYGVAGSQVQRLDWDASNTVYNWNAAQNAYVTTDGAGAYDKLTRSGTVWTWTDGDSRMTEMYDEARGGLITHTIDPDGNSLYYAFNSTNGQLSEIRVQDSAGATVERVDLGYSGKQLMHLTTVRADGSQTRVRYGYETYGSAGATRLTTVEVDLTPGDATDAAKYVTTYTYADSSSLRVASISQSDGSLLQIGYTANGTEYRVTSLTETVASGVTRVTGLFYDIAARTTRITDPLGGVTTMTYDAGGNLLELKLPEPAPGAEAPKTVFTYNANGDLLSMTENGRRTDYEYDTATGNLTLTRDAAGNRVARTYGSRNELLTLTRFQAADPDGSGPQPASAPATTRYAYDSENHLRFVVRPDGEVTEYRYSTAGAVTSVIAYTAAKYDVSTLAADAAIGEAALAAWASALPDKSAARRTDTTYDFRGNVQTVTRYSVLDANGAGVTSADYSRDTYIYTASGQLHSRINSASPAAAELFLYDGLGRIVSTTNMTNATATVAFNDGAATTTATIAGGLTRVSAYNKAGELISVTESGGNVPTGVTQYAYDGLGRLRRRTDPTGVATYFIYDNAGRKVADIATDGAMTEYVYEAGRLAKTVGYANKLTPTQIAALNDFSAGGTAGSTAAGIGGIAVGNTLLTNGGFETAGPGAASTGTGYSSTTLPGWTKVNSQTFEQMASGTGGVSASEGSYWLDLESVAGSGALLNVGPNLVLNGSFENGGTYSSTVWGRISDSLPNWTRTSGSRFETVTSGVEGVSATEGTYWLDLDSSPAGPAVPTGSNLLQNGSFDQSGTYTSTSTGRSNSTLPGWTKTNSETFEQVASGQMGVAATDGAYWLDLESTATTGPVAVGPNLLVNGGFELATSYTQTATGRTSTDIPGWTKANPEAFDQILGETTTIAATEGVYWLDLDSTPSNGGMVSGPNLIVNGSFEQSATSFTTTATGRYNDPAQNIPGWTRASGNTQGFEQVNSGANGVTASDGSFYLDMEANGGSGSRMDISQVIGNLTAGQQLTLSFDYANRAGTVYDVEGNPENSGALQVYWNGTLIGTIGSFDQTLTTKGFSVTSVAGNNTLRFREIGVTDGKGVYLDNVRLHGMVAAPNGGNMDISQTVSNLAAGQVMQLQFDHANRTTAESGSFEVWWNSTLVATIADSGAMQTKSYFVTAQAGNNVVRFKSLGTVDAKGASLDNVRLFATEAPPHGGNMDISQTVANLTAGQALQLQFDHANRTTSASGSFEVWWNGGLIATVSDSGAAMQTKTYNLTAAAGSNTLRFRSIGTVDAVGASLDNVRLFKMEPTPAGGNMDVSQTISISSAGKMRLQFDHANRTTATNGGFEVWWNGALVAAIQESGVAMQTKTYLVDAVAGNNSLSFRGTGTADGLGASLDNVRLFATEVDVGGGNMDISQTVEALAAGQAMLLRFDHANRTSAASGSFEVWWNDALVATIADTGTAMQSKSFSLTAQAGTNKVRFKSLGTVDAAGASLDNVRLFATQGSPVSAPIADRLAGLRPVAHEEDRYRWNIYDAADRLIETIDAAGAVTAFAYDGHSNLVSTTRYANLVAVEAFKTAAPTMMVLPAADTGRDRTTRSFYDKSGLLIGTLDGEGYLTENIYDESDLLIETIRYAAPTVAGDRAAGSFGTLRGGIATSAADLHNWFVYDGRGLLRGTIDGEGNLTRYHYTAAGEIDQQVRGQKLDPAAVAASRPTLASLPSGPGDQVTETTDYARNALGLVLTETRHLTGGGTSVTSYSYDSLGRMTTRTEATGTADARTLTQRYDARGNIIGQLAGEGSAALAALGASPSAAAVDNIYATWGTTYGYDAAGRLNWKSEANGADAAGNRTVYFYRGDQLVYEANALGEVVEHRYNARGERTDTIAYAARVAAGTMAGFYGGQVDGSVQAVIQGLADGTRDSATRLDYHVTGAVKRMTDALASAVTYDYNAFGEVRSRVDPLEGAVTRTTTTAYDRRGLRVSEVVDATAGGLQLETVYGYDAFGRRKQITDPSGRARRTDYDRAGRIATTTDAANRTQSFFYDGRGNVLRITDRTGAITTFAYDAFSRTTTTTSPGQVTTTVKRNAHGDTIWIRDGALRETTYVYDRDGSLKSETDGGSGQVSHEYDSAGRRKETTDQRGVRTSFEYDAANRVLRETVDVGGLSLVTRYEYDAKGQAIKIIDPDNRATTVEFDRNGRKTAVVVDSGGLALRTEYAFDKSGRLQTITEGAGTAAARITEQDFDEAGRLIETRVDPAGLKLTTRYSYDKAGNVVRKTDAAAAVTTYSYDAENRLVRSLDGENGVAETFYDGEGRITATRRYANAGSAAAAAGGAFDIAVAADSGRDQVTGYAYDGDGRLRVAVDATGRPTDYTYDGSGNVLRSTVYGGTIAYAAGDSLATLQSRMAPLAGHGENRVTRAVYDAANRQAFGIDATGAVAAFGFDASGNVIKHVRFAAAYGGTGDPTLAEMQVWAAGAAHADDRVSRTFYDRASRATFHVDGENYVTQLQYDAAGRLKKEIRHAANHYSTGDGVSEAALAAQIGAPLESASVTGFSYDSAGRLTATTDPTSSVTHLVLDALGQATDTTTAYGTADASTTRRVFDKAGRVQSETRGYQRSEASTTAYTYDGVGRTRTVTDGRQMTSETVYDNAGRVVREVQPLNQNATATTYREYDRFGNLVRMIDPRGHAGYFYYDKLNRLTLQVDPEGYATRSDYEFGSQPRSVTRHATAVSGATTAALPAIATSAKDATTVFTRDKLDRLTAVTDAENKTESYVLNAFGDRTKIINRLDGITENRFDRRGLLVEEKLPVGSTNAAGTLVTENIVNRFEHDARGNRTKTIEGYLLPEQRTTRFEYDNADRLKRKIADTLTAHEGANAVGTATPAEEYSYNARGELIETKTSWGARTLSYRDSLGRKTAELVATVSSSEGVLSTWAYDANGNVEKARIYDGMVALPALPGGGAPTTGSAYRETLYSYDANNRRTHSRVANVRSGEFASGYTSAVGDIVLETVYDAAGNVVQEKDGRLNSVFHFYDKAGRRVAKVDQENYLTVWTLDAEGNATKEERFSSPVASVDITSQLQALRDSVAAGAGNRVTDFTYDRNGRRKSETRRDVQGKALDANGFLVAASSPDAEILYDYNGLGQVTRKVEANGDFTEFEYDKMGRQTVAQSAPYGDFQNQQVRRRTETFHDALGNVTRSVDRSKSGASDRVTAHTYGIGGRLIATEDAGGLLRTFVYDSAGNVSAEYYSRQDSTGVTITEGSSYRYDRLNRVVAQAVIGWNATAWSEIVATTVRYNSFGEVTGRGLNATSSGTAYQETFDYDAAGRMWRSTSGDGTVRIYGHDKAGNATLVIASAGDNLDALDLYGALSAYAGGGSGVATTATLFDRRGQATSLVELQRQTAQNAQQVTITSTRLYNAFGELRREIDAAQRQVDYSYNTAGKLTKRELPAADYTTETGAVLTNTRASQNYAYDASGRLIGVEDAYGNGTTRLLLAGTGYEGEEATVLAEYHADGGVARKAVDEFGDVRVSTDEIDRITRYAYDKMGRLTQLDHAGGLVDYYSYDSLGRRIGQWNNFLQSPAYTPVKNLTDYDAHGRVISVVRAAGTGEETKITTSYAWNDGAVTNGLGTFGGWVKTTTHHARSNNNVSAEATDYFGRIIGKTDLNQRTYSYSYDKAGRLLQQTSSAGQNLSFTYFNTGKAATITDSYTDASASPSSVQSSFGYDILGRRVTESYTKTSYQFTWNAGYSVLETKSLQAATVAYDGAGRMKSFTDTGASGSNPVTVNWEYDRVGNVRRVLTTYKPVGLSSWQDSSPITTDRWFTYDTMNRMVHVNGYMSNGVIGSDISTVGSGVAEYDKAGQRRFFTTNFFEWETGSGKIREEYVYTDAGQLKDVRQSKAYYTDYTATALGPWSSAVTIATTARDTMGRLTGHTEYSGNVAVYSRSVAYNYRSEMIYDSTVTKMQDGSTRYTSGSYYYDIQAADASGYQGGVVTRSTVTSNVTTETTNSYVWWDDAQLSSVVNSGGSGSSATYRYDENGKLASVSITGARARDVLYVTDIRGQVMSRTEYSSDADNPAEIYYYFDGLRVGDLSNLGPSQTDYVTAINRRGADQTSAFGNAGFPVAHADFEQAFTPINPSSEPMTGANYTVREGDSLRTIAQSVWGDADMWYLIAEANGLTGTSSLAAGQALVIPAKVTNIHNNSATFRVYDPNQAIGDNSPVSTFAAKPQRRSGGCGIVGTIILVAVAVAVTAITAGAAVAALTPIATIGGGIGALAAGTTGLGLAALVGVGAAAGAVGSIVSQGLGVATGLQREFSWKGVAMAAIAGGVSGGVGGSGAFSGINSAVVKGALTAASSSALTQGVALATGLQKKFDWAGVAAAAVTGGIGAKLGGRLPGLDLDQSLGNVVAHAGVSAVRGIAGAATRSLVSGKSFGDNLLAALPEVIGTTIGNLIAGKIVAAEEKSLARRAAPGWDRQQRRALIGAARELDGIRSRPRGTALSAAAVDPGSAEALRRYTDVRFLRSREFTREEINSAIRGGFELAGLSRNIADETLPLAEGTAYPQYRTVAGQSQLHRDIEQQLVGHRFRDERWDNVTTIDADAAPIPGELIPQLLASAGVPGSPTGAVNQTSVSATQQIATSARDLLSQFRFASTNQAAAALAIVMQSHLGSGPRTNWNEWSATIYDTREQGDRRYQVGRIMEANSRSSAVISFSEMIDNPTWIPAAHWHLHPVADQRFGMVGAFFSGQDYESLWAVQQIFPGFRGYVTVAATFGTHPNPWADGSNAQPVSPWATFALGENLTRPDRLTGYATREALFTRPGDETVYAGLAVTINGNRVGYARVDELNQVFGSRPVALFDKQQAILNVGGVQRRVTISPYIVPASPISSNAYDRARAIIQPPQPGN